MWAFLGTGVFILGTGVFRKIQPVRFGYRGFWVQGFWNPAEYTDFHYSDTSLSTILTESLFWHILINYSDTILFREDCLGRLFKTATLFQHVHYSDIFFNTILTDHYFDNSSDYSVNPKMWQFALCSGILLRAKRAEKILTILERIYYSDTDSWYYSYGLTIPTFSVQLFRQNTILTGARSAPTKNVILFRQVYYSDTAFMTILTSGQFVHFFHHYSDNFA